MIKEKTTHSKTNLSNIEDIFTSLTELVCNEYSDGFELFEHKTFKQFSEMYIVPPNVENTAEFWKIFEESTQYEFIEELDEVLKEFESFKAEFTENFKTMKFLDENIFCNKVTDMMDKHLVQTPYELIRIRDELI